MIFPIRASSSVISRPSSIARGSRSTASWFSSCVQRKRSPDESNLSLRVHINQKSSELRPYRSDEIVGSAGNAAMTRNEASAAITEIEEIHRDAILQKRSTYTDPSTGFTVFTELAHLKRGRCCGNQCRHCPYGWSNVKSATGGFSTPNDNARAISGNREGTGRLVNRILDGKYYEEDERSQNKDATTRETSNAALNNDVTDRANCNATNNKGANAIATSQTSSKSVLRGEGKGGSAGGTLTSKNVPYTRKGDAGTSQLFTGERRNKDDILFEALGTVDELCSIAGVVYAELIASQEKKHLSNSSEGSSKDDAEANNTMYGDVPEQLLEVMSRLFDVGSHIARPTPQRKEKGELANGQKRSGFHSHHTELLEAWIDTMTEELPELTSFILPTGSPASAQLHVSRTVCRRAERRMVPLVQQDETVDPEALAYVNRLSDYFFTAARFVNYCDDRDEVQYRSGEQRGLNNEGENDAISQRERVVVKLKK